MEFKYSITDKAKHAVIVLSGNLIDRTQALPMLADVEELISRGINHFVIDLAQFGYLNSNGLNVLINILTKSRKAGGETVVCSVSDKIKELLLITKLNSFFTISDNLENAQKKVQLV